MDGSEEIHVYRLRDEGKTKADESLYDNTPTGESRDSSLESDSVSTVSMTTPAAYKRIMTGPPSSDSSEESLYESAVDQDANSRAAMNDDMGVDAPLHTPDHFDLASSVKGLYRILDLIAEQGSGGLVDKIIISQNSLETFINLVSPGAYASMTKANFKALDHYIVKPVGVYGSKEEIVRFFSELRVVDDALAAQLLADPNISGPTKPTLRSGLYVLRPTEPYGQTEQIFVVYWPQENTWDDSAPSQVRRNRVTFMRYLTKMCDQVVALISSVHAQTIVWNDGDKDDNDARDEDCEGHRIIKCVVDRTTEQEESVQVREGFRVASGLITYAGSVSEASAEQGQLKPFLLFGETAQGLMTAQHQAARRVAEPFKARSLTPLQLEGHLTSDSLCLSESLDDQALGILVRGGLKKRFPDECTKWTQELDTVGAHCKRMRTDEFGKMRATFDKEEENLTLAIYDAVMDIVLNLYPFLDRASFPHPRVHQATTPMSFQEIATLYPKVDEVFQLNIKPVETISSSKFGEIKDRLCLLVEFISRVGEISKTHRHAIAKAATKEGYKAAQYAMRDAFKNSSTAYTTQLSDNHSALLIYNPTEDVFPLMGRAVSYVTSVFSNPREDKTAIADRVLREALGKANNISDSQFLKEIVNAEVIQEEPELKRLVEEATLQVQSSLATTIPHVVKKLVGLVRQVQEETMKESIKVHTESREEQAKRELRLQLIRHVNDVTRQTQQQHTLSIESVESKSYYSSQCKVSGVRETREEPMTCFTVHTMSLTEQDKHNLQLDVSIIPSPRFHSEYKFRLAQDYTVLRAQLLEGEKLLLIVLDRVGNLMVYLDRLTAIDAAIGRRHGKSLNREKIGQDFVLAFDESKRMLSIVSSDKLLLHIFVYDDT